MPEIRTAAGGRGAARTAAALMLSWLVTGAAAPANAQEVSDRRLDRVLTQTPLIDGHNDLPWEIRERFGGDLAKVDLSANTAALPAPSGSLPMMTDIPRLRRGRVGAQFWSVFIPVEMKGPQAVQATLEQIDLVKAMCARYPRDLAMAYSAADIRRLHKAGQIASLVGVEGGHQINDSLPVLRAYYDAGARYLTLTHSSNTAWADSATDMPVHHGLTAFGKEVVREMNRLGMLVDLAHVSEETMRAALAVTQAPVIFSHSSARALVDHPRDVPDEVLRLVAANGGIVMVNFAPPYVSDARRRWEAERVAEEARNNSPPFGGLYIGSRTARPRRSKRGTRRTRNRRSQWLTWPITSSTSARWRASTTQASALTSTAFPRPRTVWKASNASRRCCRSSSAAAGAMPSSPRSPVTTCCVCSRRRRS